jgi:hypothetical protein
LRRAADFWSSVLPSNTQWYPTVGAQLEVELDEGEDFNAYYDRQGLHFFHGSAAARTIYSGESPDVVCHEFGHAVLDALRPQLFNVASPEPPAFHEAWGDMSAMLSTLQLPSFRSSVLKATAGQLERSSRLSRLAEQLGWAIRQHHPEAVDADSLRSASNAFFYRDPVTLPPMAPASTLSSEPHSFSRVFSGAFLTALAGMYDAQAKHDEAALEQVSHDAGRLLVEAARTAPVCVGYYSQVAAHMLAVDQQEFSGRYAEPLRAGFLRHGVLSLGDAMAPPAAAAPAPLGMVAAETSQRGSEHATDLPRIALAGNPFGLDEDFLVTAASEPKRFAVAGAAAVAGSVADAPHDQAAGSFVEDLFRRQQIAADREVPIPVVTRQSQQATHELRREGGAIVLERRLFQAATRALS